MNMPPLNRFTTNAKNVVRKAHEIAIERGQNTVTPSHLWAALLLIDSEILISTFEKLNIDYPLLLDNILDELVDLENATMSDSSTSYQLYLSPELIIILEESDKLSIEMQDSFIDSEHLFLATLLNPSSSISELAQKFKLDQTNIFETIFKIKESGEKIQPKKKYKALQRFGKNLTQLAKENKLDPVIGRDEEISRAIEILSRRKKNNPILIGEAGVGKTAVVEGIAQKIIDKNVPQDLLSKEIFALDMGLLVAGTKFRGEFEERLKTVIKEVNESHGKIILFIDEVHSIVGAGASDGAMDASNILKPSLARGELSLIGATTISEYKKHIEKDQALTRRFQSIIIDEPNTEKTLEILEGIRSKYEIFHGIKISDEALKSAIELSSRFITDRFLPDKAIDLIDEASSVAKISLDIKPLNLEKIEKEILHLEIEKRFSEKNKNSKKDISKLEKEIRILEDKKEGLAKNWEKEKKIVRKIKDLQSHIHDLNKEALILRSEKKIDEFLELENIKIEALKNTLIKEEKKLKKAQGKDRVLFQEIGSSEIEKIVSRWTGIPVNKMSSDDFTKISKIDEKLREKIIGQDEIITSIASTLKRSKVGLSDPQKPLASFLFLGPTGVGKTELSKQITEYLFHKKGALIKIDMSELMESHSVSKLIGSPPGYVGFDEGGSLTEKVRRNPHSVILFDEIEKASPNILNILLQILDEGKVTDAQGTEINFKNTIIILTSNMGARFLKENSKIGFSKKEDVAKEGSTVPEKMKGRIIQSVKNYLNPEFLNRIDEILIFKPLEKESILKILKLEIDKIKNRLILRNIFVEISDTVLENILDDDYNFEHGARPVKRLLQKKILNPLTEEILKVGSQEGNLKIDLKKDKIIFNFKSINSSKNKKMALNLKN